MSNQGVYKIPERTNMSWWVCDRWVEEGRSDDIAIYQDDRKITFAMLQEMQNRFGNALKSLGINRGDKILFRLPNSAEYFSMILGSLKIGAIPCPTNTLFGTSELEHILNNSDAVLAVTNNEFQQALVESMKKNDTIKKLVLLDERQDEFLSYWDLVKDASPDLEKLELKADDPAFVFYTSGTTGPPKGILHVHRWINVAGENCNAWMDYKASDIVLHPQEISFSYPFGTAFVCPLFKGASVVAFNERITPEKALESIDKYRVTIFCSVPTLYKMIMAIPEIEKNYDLKSLRHVICAGETLPAKIFHGWNSRIGCEILEAWGGSEPHAAIGNPPGSKIKPGSMGKPFHNLQIAVLDDDGNPSPINKLGNLGIRDDMPNLHVEYLKNPDLWKSTHKFGYFFIGDLAYKDEDGYYWYVSRSDDLIKSRGYLISPKEVEDTIMEHPAIANSGVIGAPDEVMGHKVKAFVILLEEHQPTEELALQIRDHVKSRIAPFKAPKQIEFVKELPLTGTGKILRRELRRVEKERLERGETVGFDT
ncbi:MAG: acyl-CoA synthetase [Thaumarchaeota archaeon]|nr:acyl-CoA synthetase [Nitrososphaerota archaeon]